MLRALRRSGRVRPIDYQAERRRLAEARRAAFVVPPSGPNQVWQLVKYEHLYRVEINDGHRLGLEVETYRQLFNKIRPHEALAMRRHSTSTSKHQRPSDHQIKRA